ncbi:glycine zipper 2TM domain-containing protein [Rudaea sp.]|uniref:glycine zipper 2TM domain-containing protein n=1 Tax=Rudaea sp. TaxID=2136325 RepID=UPI002F92F6AD
MLRNRGWIVLMLVALFGLNACVAPPPRQRVVYREPAQQQGYDQRQQGYDQRQQGYDQRDQGDQPSGRCRACGTVRGVDQVQISQQTTGGGAILGAIIGGVIGNQFGRGGGRAAATAVGAVGGAVIGDSAEQNNARAASGYAWRFYVELDDGRQAQVTQTDNPGFHVGDRVLVRGGRGDGHLEMLRR